MRVQSVNNQSFLAGKVNLSNVKPNKLLNMNSLKSIAESNNADIFILKHSESKYLPDNDMYTAMVKKDEPWKRFHCGVALSQKTDNERTVTEKIFGALYEALEKFE